MDDERKKVKERGSYIPKECPFELSLKYEKQDGDHATTWRMHGTRGLEAPGCDTLYRRYKTLIGSFTRKLVLNRRFH